MGDEYFFHAPADLDLDGVFWTARDRDRQEILEAIAQAPPEPPRVLAVAPALAEVLNWAEVRFPAVIDTELVSYAWELRVAR
jgi:nitrous oxidase accessory protein NosD